MKLWYMYDNHTFRLLPLDADGAMSRLREAFINERAAYGMLCTHDGPMKDVLEHAGAEWGEFAPRARAWLEAALKPTDAEIEYTSWAVTTSSGSESDAHR